MFFPPLLQSKHPLKKRLICESEAAADNKNNITGTANAH